MNKILFLDLDGTVRRTKSGAKFINDDPHDQELIPGVAEAMEFAYLDWVKIGITNQGGVAAGHKSLEKCIEEQLYTLEISGLDEIYFCPNYEGIEAYRITKNERSQEVTLIKQAPNLPFGSFRKPGAGMINYASPPFLDDCLMVGDRPEDKQAAQAAGVRFMWAHDWWKI